MPCYPILSTALPRAVTHVRRVIRHHANPVGRGHVHAHHVPGTAGPVTHGHVVPRPTNMIVCTRVPGAPPLGAVPGAPVAGGPGVPFQAGGAPGAGYGGGVSPSGFFGGAGAGVAGLAGMSAAAKAGVVAGGLALAALGVASATGAFSGYDGPDRGTSVVFAEQPVPAPGPAPDQLMVPDVALPGVPSLDVQVPELSAPVPEPGTAALFGTSCLVMMLRRRWTRRAEASGTVKARGSALAGQPRT